MDYYVVIKDGHCLMVCDEAMEATTYAKNVGGCVKHENNK